jgi:catalase
MTPVEKQHIIEGFRFELGKVETKEIRQRMVDHLERIDHNLAEMVALGIGVEVRRQNQPANPRQERMDGSGPSQHIDRSPAVSAEESTVRDTIKSRRIAILAAGGFREGAAGQVKQALEEAGAHVKVVSKYLGTLHSENGTELKVDMNYVTTGSIMFDAILILGGRESAEMLSQQGDALHFVNEAFKHCKPIAAVDEGVKVLEAAHLMDVNLAEENAGRKVVSDKGVVTLRDSRDVQEFTQAFIQAIAHHRHWEREKVADKIPA